MHLMRQRKMLDGAGMKRKDSFNTEIGMTFSVKNDNEESGRNNDR